MLKGRGAHILSIGLLLTVMLMAFGGGSAMGQRRYANSYATGPAGSGNNTATFTNPNNSVSIIPTTQPSGFMTMTIKAAANNTHSSYFTLIFDSSNLPSSDKTIFIKVASTSGLTAGAYNGASLATGSISSSFTASDGTNYITVSASSAFDRVRITGTVTGGLLSATTRSFDIFHAFYESTCSSISTSTAIGAIGSITNPTNAIDGNLTTASLFSMTLGLASTISQTIYYSTLSDISDVATLRLSIPSSGLSAGVLASISIKAFNGPNEVNSITFGSLLQGTDLLTLLGLGNIVDIPYTPNARFNRIEISMTSLLSLSTNLHLYEVTITPPLPALVSATNVTICVGDQTTLSASSSGALITWYDQTTGGNILATSGTLTVSPTSTKTYYVSTINSCAIESARIPVVVNVNPKPPAPHIVINTNSQY